MNKCRKSKINSNLLVNLRGCLVSDHVGNNDATIKQKKLNQINKSEFNVIIKLTCFYVQHGGCGSVCFSVCQQQQNCSLEFFYYYYYFFYFIFFVEGCGLAWAKF